MTHIIYGSYKGKSGTWKPFCVQGGEKIFARLKQIWGDEIVMEMRKGELAEKHGIDEKDVEWGKKRLNVRDGSKYQSGGERPILTLTERLKRFW